MFFFPLLPIISRLPILAAGLLGEVRDEVADGEDGSADEAVRAGGEATRRGEEADVAGGVRSHHGSSSLSSVLILFSLLYIHGGRISAALANTLVSTNNIDDKNECILSSESKP